MSNATVIETDRSSDGIYKAINMYLDKHKCLTSPESEMVCRVLDCSKMSEGARRHAARNERLPTRVVVQVLFAGHMRLKDTIIRERQAAMETEEDAEEAETARMICSGGGEQEEEAWMEMEQMGNKVMELERECSMMRREISQGLCQRGKRESLSLWRELKRKLNCKSYVDDCKCHVVKKKKKKTRVQQTI